MFYISDASCLNTIKVNKQLDSVFQMLNFKCEDVDYIIITILLLLFTF